MLTSRCHGNNYTQKLEGFFSSKFGKDNLKNNHNEQNTIYNIVKEALTFKLD